MSPSPSPSRTPNPSSTRIGVDSNKARDLYYGIMQRLRKEIAERGPSPSPVAPILTPVFFGASIATCDDLPDDVMAVIVDGSGKRSYVRTHGSREVRKTAKSMGLRPELGIGDTRAYFIVDADVIPFLNESRWENLERQAFEEAKEIPKFIPPEEDEPMPCCVCGAIDKPLFYNRKCPDCIPEDEL